MTAKSLNLVLGTTMLGAANGVLYAALRTAIPRGLRVPLWSLFAAAAGGAAVVHEEGIDFQVLEPAALAVALFVVLPGLAAVLVVVLVERWIPVDPSKSGRLRVTLVVAAVAGTLALVVAAVVGGIALGLRREPRVAGLVGRAARVAVPAVLVAATVVAGFGLVSEASRII